MNLEWRRMRAVVFESDDWGFCAWSPDEHAFRVLAGTPSFRTPAGRRYGGSTLESAADVKALVQTLLEFRGGDGFPPVWQANTVMAAPDFARLAPPLFETAVLPLVDLPAVPSRWERPGMWNEVREAMSQGAWWVELHGLHHLPEAAWLNALRRGADDARRAHEQQSAICLAVESSGEYDPSEPAAIRQRNVALAIEKFESLTGRKPRSLCFPDYRWDDAIEAQVETHGIEVVQGKGEQFGVRFPRLRRLLLRYRWPHRSGRRFYMPPRIAFEPCREGGGIGSDAVSTTHRAARDAWSRGQPAVISSHRVNYAHLDPAWSESGRASLRRLLDALAEDGAVFLTDLEVHQLVERGWSLREIGERAALLRYYGVPREPLRFPAPAGVSRVAVREGRADGVEVGVTGGEVVARLNVGEYLLEWNNA
jgi:hypothetical protein